MVAYDWLVGFLNGSTPRHGSHSMCKSVLLRKNQYLVYLTAGFDYDCLGDYIVPSWAGWPLSRASSLETSVVYVLLSSRKSWDATRSFVLLVIKWQTLFLRVRHHRS